MKRGIKTCLGIGIITLGIGIIVLVLAVSFGRVNTVNASDILMFEDAVSDVNSLEFNIPYGEVSLIEGNEFKVEISNIVEGDYASEVVNGTWKIKGNKKKNMFKIFNFELPAISFGNGKWSIGESNNTKIVITVPKDKVFSEVKIEIGAGTFNLDYINADRISIEAGAGEVKIDKLISSKTAAFDIGAGTIKVFDSEVYDLSINCGVGEMVYRGLVNGKCDADNGVGSISMNLNNIFDNCYFNVDCGIGSVKINNDKYRTGKIGDKSAAHYFKLNCGVGEINIKLNK